MPDPMNFVKDPLVTYLEALREEADIEKLQGAQEAFRKFAVSIDAYKQHLNALEANDYATADAYLELARKRMNEATFPTPW